MALCVATPKRQAMVDQMKLVSLLKRMLVFPNHFFLQMSHDPTEKQNKIKSVKAIKRKRGKKTATSRI